MTVHPAKWHMVALAVWSAVTGLATVRGEHPDPAVAQAQRAWQSLDRVPDDGPGRVGIRPRAFKAWQLDRHQLEAHLAAAPQEVIAVAGAAAMTLALPMPDGSLARFEVFESPAMEAPLAAKFPQIRTFVGRGVDDPGASLRFDLTPHGFHAQVLSPRGAVYIDPYSIGDDTLHVSYFKRDAAPRDERFECLTPADDPAFAEAIAGAAGVASDGNLRRYRLANAATAEYTQFHGGTVELGLAAVVTAINRVSGIYEIDLGVRLMLVANNHLLIYTNENTDPYSNGDELGMLGQNQANINSVIGNANYDVGHVFGTGGGGVAGLRVVCRTNQKAQGVTSLNSPVGDPFYIDYVAHELGHQFGGNHSFNGIRSSCNGNGNGPTAYEPGSGSTIMAYAGICGADNLQPHSDPYFHFVSIQEVASYITTGSGSTCPVLTPIGGAIPTVNAGPDYVIPSRTPFVLTAAGDDPDGDALTYCWEQRDIGPAATLNAADDGSIPLFRSFNPTTQSRTFPRLSNILNNTSTLSEKLPTLDRSMDFRVTVRDNVAGGGQTSIDDMVVTVEGSAGPFQVTFPNTAVSVSGGLTVTWNVAGSDLPPVSASTANILLSLDGGLTFPMTLAAGVPNDGSRAVGLPDLFSSTARIKVEGAGNIFFDISNSNFTIHSCVEVFAAQAEPDGIAKNRYIALNPGNAGIITAVRVKLVDLPPPFNVFNGQVRWLGPPQTVNEPSPPNAAYTIAEVQCDPLYIDWGAFGLIHGYGKAIVAGANYDVQIVNCDPSDEGNFTAALTIATARWGDVTVPYNPPDTSTQPDAVDIAILVDKFKGSNAISTPRADLYPDVPDHVADGIDIAACVAAFKGFPYPFGGPVACPP